MGQYCGCFVISEQVLASWHTQSTRCVTPELLGGLVATLQLLMLRNARPIVVIGTNIHQYVVISVLGRVDFAVLQDAYQDMGSENGSCSESGSEESASSTGFGLKLVSCLSIMRASSTGETGVLEPHRPVGQHHRVQGRLLAGCSFMVGLGQHQQLHGARRLGKCPL